ncbi:MAG: alkaline phosphatase [Hyphomonas sp.]|nr:alkaline phosphatase [Hyphomonas sp.]MCB9971055.1 alkaline phosphatase [Hyphomonas sp.]
MRKILAATLPAFALLAACSAPAAPKTEAPAAPAAPAFQRTAAVPQQAGDSYYVRAAKAVDARIAERGVKPAKNVILFIGDGMGVSTITAARIYAGQARGVDGESYRLTMETLPYSALSKTYSNDFQVADSASTATAMVTGVKTNSRTLGITSGASYDNCATVDGHRTDSLFDLAERAGLATGVVTTARLSHATPASTYSETPNRDWEAYVGAQGAAAGSCEDIAAQLIDWPEGDGFEVAFGGGRSNFMKQGTPDPEEPVKTSFRRDDRDLIAEWEAKDDHHKYITDLAGFEAEDFTGEDKVLGLFDNSHMQFDLDRADDPAGEPSLAEMTRAAITRLSQDPDGFVLMVEGGRIDHAHHAGNAARALSDTDAFDQAIAAALDMTSRDDTLVIVTADHSHTLTISGYPSRGNPILGKVDGGAGGGYMKAIDGKPYTTLSYANGPGACRAVGGDLVCTRLDLTDVDTTDKDFLQQSEVPMLSEAHGGEDVAVFASGPGANLVSGVIEENEIFQVMGRASGLVAAPATDE